MSGSKRKSGYRKGVTTKYEEWDLQLAQDEIIVKVIANKGSNLFEVNIPSNSNDKTVTALLPNKFKNLIWIKRDDYVIISMLDATIPASNEISHHDSNASYEIKFILNKDHIKRLKSANRWPQEFDSPPLSTSVGIQSQSTAANVINNIVVDDLMAGYCPPIEAEEEEEET